MSTPSPINESLRQHVATVSGWTAGANIDLADTAKKFYAWSAIFVDVFQLGVETPAIQIENLPRHRLGHYRRGHNGFGLPHEIAINQRYLTRPLGRLLGTLFHELLHQWQHVHGRAGGGNYHNKQFRAKAESYGLLVDARGHTDYVAGKFTDLLAQHGVALDGDPLFAQPVAKPPAPTKNKKHRCRCTTVYCAVELLGRCLRCNELFVLVTPRRRMAG